MGETFDFEAEKIKRITVDEMEKIIKDTPIKDIDQLIEKYREVLTYHGCKIPDEEIKDKLMTLKIKWIMDGIENRL